MGLIPGASGSYNRTMMRYLLFLFLPGCLLISKLPFARCGDGFLDQGEVCDDGNLDNEDDCLDVCANSAAEMPDVSGVEEASIQNAIFGFASIESPAGSGTSLAVLQILASDRSDLCEKLTSLDPNFAADSSIVTANVTFTEAGAGGAFPTDAPRSFSGNGADPFVGAQIDVRVGTEVVTTLVSDGNRGTFQLDSFGETLRGTFTDTLLNNGAQVDLTLRVAGATHCPFFSAVLQALLEQGAP